MDDYRRQFRLDTMCRVLNVSRSGYYYWRSHQSSSYHHRNASLVQEIRHVYHENHQVYGSPRITRALRARGIVCNVKRVASLMQKHDIWAKTKKRFKVTTNSSKTKNASPNLVKQQFNAEGPNRLWTSDFTSIWTWEGWLYLAVVLEVFSRRIIGYAMSHSSSAQLIENALHHALTDRTVAPGLVFHSDRGSQYSSDTVRAIINKQKMEQSMSGTGNCYDNAITETFFHTLKTEMVSWERFETRDEARRKIFEYIELFYNRKRLHSSIGYMAPVEFENRSLNNMAVNNND
jgi:putative transposase